VWNFVLIELALLCYVCAQFLLDDRQLYHWLTALEETGFALLTGVPAEPGQLHRIAARVAYLRKTLLG